MTAIRHAVALWFADKDKCETLIIALGLFAASVVLGATP